MVPFHSRVFPFLRQEEEYTSSSWYFTYLYDGHNGARGKMGTSIVAEAFLDFGLIGVLIVMYVGGMLSGIFYRRIRRPIVAIDHVVYYAIFTSSVLVGARGSLSVTFFRNVLWPIAVYLALKWIARNVFFASRRSPVVLAGTQVQQTEKSG